MEKPTETNLQVISNTGILKRLINFLKRIFYKNDVKYPIDDNKSLNNKNSFLKNIKFKEDPDKEMLLKIQDDLEKNGINTENAYNLTKNLSETQKIKLLNLYKEQIEMYESSIKSYKNRILAIRKKIV